MKIYDEIQRHLSQNQMSVLYSEWNQDSEGCVTDLNQRVECVDPEKVKSRIEAEILSTGKPMVSHLEGHAFMAEPFFPEERLIVLGGGHVALPLVEFASRVGFSVTVVDDREEFANRDRFPWATEVICREFASAIRSLNITGRDYVCVVTRGHSFDEICISGVLAGEEPHYLGMIGSKRHAAMVKEQMKAEGYSDAKIERIHTPIGLAIGAISVPEIAISILAELIQVRRLGTGSGDMTKMDQDYNVVAKLAAGSDQGMAVLTVISAFGSAPRKAGAKMIVFRDGKTLGSIGGGSGEAIAIGIAKAIIGTGRACVRSLELNQDAAAAEGLVCGGRIEVLIQDVK